MYSFCNNNLLAVSSESFSRPSANSSLFTLYTIPFSILIDEYRFKLPLAIFLISHSQVYYSGISDLAYKLFSLAKISGIGDICLNSLNDEQLKKEMRQQY